MCNPFRMQFLIPFFKRSDVKSIGEGGGERKAGWWTEEGWDWGL